MTTETPVSDERRLGRIEGAWEANMKHTNKQLAYQVAQLEKLQAQMKQLSRQLDAHMARLELHMAQTEARMLRWQIGMWITTILMLLGVAGLILNG